MTLTFPSFEVICPHCKRKIIFAGSDNTFVYKCDMCGGTIQIIDGKVTERFAPEWNPSRREN